jgi:cellulose synthase/poly-beta-1,6-N-acetylglucosamine synthase-like glycosyltransferase
VIAVDLLLGAIAIILSIPVAVILAQVVFAYLPNTYESERATEKATMAVLIPAHNEEDGIVATINSILPQLRSGDRLLVVADNCSDKTARIAFEKGAEVIERNNTTDRGKGFALDYGIQFLAQNPPDVVVIIDADCIVKEDALCQLVGYSILHHRPVQCLYLMLAPHGTGLKVKIAEFAWIVKNLVRPRGYAKLGLPCQLMGSGMAFPWAAIANVNLANGNIVEDLKLGVDLARAGFPPLFFEKALVTSYFPSTSAAQSVQRTRWEHGHLSMILTQAPMLFVQSFIRSNKHLLVMAFDLCVPPIALLVMLQGGFLVLATTVYVMGIAHSPLIISLFSVGALTLAIVLAWWGWARHVISLTTFLFIPIYVLSKIPHYLKFLFNRQKQWVRTDRK